MFLLLTRFGLGVRSSNVELQKALNPQVAVGIERYGSRFVPGGKVMQTENNYEKVVLNHDIVMIRNVDVVEQVVSIDFDEKTVDCVFDELSLAYVCTIYKSQGWRLLWCCIPSITKC